MADEVYEGGAEDEIHRRTLADDELGNCVADEIHGRSVADEVYEGGAADEEYGNCVAAEVHGGDATAAAMLSLLVFFDVILDILHGECAICEVGFRIFP